MDALALDFPDAISTRNECAGKYANECGLGPIPTGNGREEIDRKIQSHFRWEQEAGGGGGGGWAGWREGESSRNRPALPRVPKMAEKMAEKRGKGNFAIFFLFCFVSLLDEIILK